MAAFIILQAAKNTKKQQEEDEKKAKEKAEKKAKEDKENRAKGLIPQNRLANPDSCFEHVFKRKNVIHSRYFVGTIALTLFVTMCFLQTEPMLMVFVVSMFIWLVTLVVTSEFRMINGNEKPSEYSGCTYQYTNYKHHYYEVWVPDPNFKPKRTVKSTPSPKGWNKGWTDWLKNPKNDSEET